MGSSSRIVLAAAVVVLAIAVVVQVARSERERPARCPAGSVERGPRCCPQGQELRGASCVGQATACPAIMEHTGTGCEVTAARVRYEGGPLEIGATDWEAEGIVKEWDQEVLPFSLDASEVTFAAWAECSAASACPEKSSTEPGLPVASVTAEHANAYCKFVGGRLPTSEEWLFAASGTDGRRYPWGQTGLVCRRAVFGLEDGPCGHGAKGPDLAGSRPDGATAEGALDLAGNVAELTLEPGGGYVARGGSYRSRAAAELKSWASEPADSPGPHIGFRCAYPER